jgi:DNA-binding HxlR family transcriptional regulator
MASFNGDVKCPITATLGYIGGRWKTIILYFLSQGKKRFGQIAVRLPTISKKVLTQQLKELERDGLIIRRQYSGMNPRVEYSLTELGKSLSSVLNEMASWGKEHALVKR